MTALATCLLLIVPLLPVLAGVLVFHVPRILPLVPWLPLSALLLIPLHGTIIDYPWLLLGSRVGVDTTGVALLLLGSVVWTAAGCHARRTIAAAEQPRFFFFWLATWCGNLCVFITFDAASFYAAYAMTTFAAWGLVVHNRRPEDYRAGRVYIVMALLGEGLLIAGLLLIGSGAGNFALESAAATVAGIPASGPATYLLLGGFAVKMGLVGLHMWLPLAHPCAPVPASAVLSGVILKAGLVGWIRFLPLGEDGFATAGTVLLSVGLVTAAYGVAVGVGQQRAKVVLAYSSMSQMGLAAAAVGLALAVPPAAPALVAVAVLLAVHHGLAKSALFIGIDLAARSPRLARRLLWLPAASLAGLPLTSGALAKTAFKSEMPPGFATWLEPALFAASVLTTGLLARYLWLVWPRRGGSGASGPVAPWLALLAASLSLPWLLVWLVRPDWVAAALDLHYLPDALLPVVLGSVAAVIAARYLPWTPRFPEGDVVVLLHRPRRRTLPMPRLRLPDWTPLLALAEDRPVAGQRCPDVVAGRAVRAAVRLRPLTPLAAAAGLTKPAFVTTPTVTPS
ncbi:MAG: proton-conducting transporter membrane subunit [Halioglobus sp.]|nr:proton-conducting transporter membrane subunit [Halioglobus sp.]